MPTLSESVIESLMIELLQEQGYHYISQKKQWKERKSTSEVVLQNRLKTAIDNFNPALPDESKWQALQEVLNL